jgi:hypothetical protein
MSNLFSSFIHASFTLFFYAVASNLEKCQITHLGFRLLQHRQAASTDTNVTIEMQDVAITTNH